MIVYVIICVVACMISGSSAVAACSSLLDTVEPLYLPQASERVEVLGFIIKFINRSPVASPLPAFFLRDDHHATEVNKEVYLMIRKNIKSIHPYLQESSTRSSTCSLTASLLRLQARSSNEFINISPTSSRSTYNFTCLTSEEKLGLSLMGDMVQDFLLHTNETTRSRTQRQRHRKVKIMMMKIEPIIFFEWLCRNGVSYGEIAMVSFIPSKVVLESIFATAPIYLAVMVLVFLVFINIYLQPSSHPSCNIQIYVKTWSGKLVAVNLTPRSTISSLNQILCMHSNIGPDSYLLYGGKCLQSIKTLESYGIGKGSILFEIQRLRGGMPPSAREVFRLQAQTELFGLAPKRISPSQTPEGRRMRRQRTKENALLHSEPSSSVGTSSSQEVSLSIAEKEKNNRARIALNKRNQRSKKPNEEQNQFTISAGPKKRCKATHNNKAKKEGVDPEKVAREAKADLIKDTFVNAQNSDEWCPIEAMKKQPIRDLKRDCQDAIAFRKEMDERIPSEVCAVCNSYRPITAFNEDAEGWIKLQNVIGLSALSCDQAKEEGSRHIRYEYDGLEYSLQPAACKIDQLGEASAHICKDCIASLERKSIPKWSLARFDAGEIPKAANPEDQLLPLTMLEANLLAGIRVMRYCYVIRPWGEPDQVQKKQKGHVIAFPNNPVDKLLQCFPLPLDKIPEVIQCIFLMIAKQDDLHRKKKLAAQSKALHVRGRQIVLWARHLAKVSCHALPSPHLTLIR